MSTFKLALVLFRYFSFLLLLSAIIVHFAVAFVYVWFISIMNRRDAIECVSVCVCVRVVFNGDFYHSTHYVCIIHQRGV